MKLAMIIRKSSFSEPPAKDYIDSLLKKRLSTLLSEPHSLAIEENKTQTELDLVLYEHRGDLVETSTSMKSIDSILIETHSTFKSLDKDITSFESKCDVFASNAAKLILLRDSFNRASLKTDTLISLLGVPTAMEELVRLGCYDDAIDLLATIARMKSR